MKLLLKLILFFLLYISLAKNVNAESNFGSAIRTDYYLQDDGTIKVDQRVAIKNLTSESFVTDYGMVVYTDDLESVVARDSLGDILKDYQKINDKTQISLKFNEEAVGKGTELKFRISYTTKSLYKNQGRIKEIYIPPSPDSDFITTYTVVLHIPDTYNRERNYKPHPRQVDDKSVLWTKEELKDTGAKVFIGTSSIYSVKLRYDLENSSFSSSTKTITIPPDTSYQKVVINSISPTPENVVLDIDGNWIGEYTLKPKQSLDVILDLAIEVFIQPRSEFSYGEVDPKIYTATQEYWEVDDPELNKLGKNLKTPRAIYEYVTDTLSYNYSKIEEGNGRVGAKVALIDTKNAICTEFTDLFITLSRAAGVPAREVNGYAYSSDPDTQPLSLVLDLLHAWPEYYDTKLKIWKPVDPTWGNTTGGADYFSLLDFSHIAFVKRGLSSTQPLSAGVVRNTKEGEYISVKLLDKMPEINLVPTSIKLDLPASVPSGKPVAGYLVIDNPNNFALLNVLPSLESHPIKISKNINKIDILPPLSKTRVPFQLSASYSLEKVNNTVSASYMDKHIEQNILISDWKEFIKPYLIGIGLGSGVFLVFIYIFRLSVWKKE